MLIHVFFFFFAFLVYYQDFYCALCFSSSALTIRHALDFRRIAIVVSFIHSLQKYIYRRHYSRFSLRKLVYHYVSLIALYLIVLMFRFTIDTRCLVIRER
ncbi:hypothetical protein ARMSODRAFT_343152 [Armillaria solidipes]|uniref:Uncharacterized protein n=1 Tax=Armillaria solidipes TaxID=1076256 RepID=A0A2H3BQB2_9AGAR|nr:hypothetical protein ARMSODRAFT_343152 [Armillaria solidipes]